MGGEADKEGRGQVVTQLHEVGVFLPFIEGTLRGQLKRGAPSGL